MSFIYSAIGSSTNMNHGSSSATCEAMAWCEENLECSGWLALFSSEGYSSLSVFLSSGGVGGVPELFGEVDDGNFTAASLSFSRCSHVQLGRGTRDGVGTGGRALFPILAQNKKQLKNLWFAKTAFAVYWYSLVGTGPPWTVDRVPMKDPTGWLNVAMNIVYVLVPPLGRSMWECSICPLAKAPKTIFLIKSIRSRMQKYCSSNLLLFGYLKHRRWFWNKCSDSFIASLRRLYSNRPAAIKFAVFCRFWRQVMFWQLCTALQAEIRQRQ